jgi:uncharacterized protein (TIGR02001 family)
VTHRAFAAAALALGLALAQPLAAQPMPELSYGLAITSNYIDKGSTQSDDNPALQGYVEAAVGMVYGGVWSSTVDFADDPEFGGDQIEFDLYAGIRPSFGDLSLDLSYYRYLYDDSGDCCGDIILTVEYPMADIGAIGGEFAYDPENETQWGELGASVSFLTDWEVGGTVGTDFGSFELGGDDKVAWDVGVTRALGDFAAVDLRYYDSNYDPDRGVVTIGMDF